jgi:lysophospholipase L1-like esterase
MIPSIVNAVTRIKIMPLGDSITWGAYGAGLDGIGGYRNYLYHALSLSGYSINFVGSVNGPAETGVDPYHEGWRGGRIDELNDKINNRIISAQPDIVLLCAGTNDLIQQSTSATVLSRLSRLIDNIFKARPTTHVMVASILNVKTPNDYSLSPLTINQYNHNLPEIVAQRATNGKKISFVNLSKEVAFGSEDFHLDGLHPSEKGYKKISDVWFSHLKLIFNSSNITINDTHTA